MGGFLKSEQVVNLIDYYFYRFFPWIANAIRPFLPPLSVLVTACCVGAPLAINVKSVVSPFGATILSLIISFHLLAFVIGYVLTGLIFPKAPDLKALQRTMSFETGTAFIINPVNFTEICIILTDNTVAL